MSERPKQNQPVKTKAKKPLKGPPVKDDETGTGSKAKGSYYYDDAYGYEDYAPETKDREEEDKTPNSSV